MWCRESQHSVMLAICILMRNGSDCQMPDDRCAKGSKRRPTGSTSPPGPTSLQKNWTGSTPCSRPFAMLCVHRLSSTSDTCKCYPFAALRRCHRSTRVWKQDVDICPSIDNQAEHDTLLFVGFLLNQLSA